MAKIRGRDTGPEKLMAALLDTEGIPYQRYAKISGTPDFVVGKLALFVDGDFWHGKNFWHKAPKLNPYWYNKIMNNILRDRKVDNMLRIQGMTVLRIWESELKNPPACIRKIKKAMTRATIPPSSACKQV